jgi:hypothetical protein
MESQRYGFTLGAEQFMLLEFDVVFPRFFAGTK